MMRKVNIEILEPHGVVRPKPRGLGAIKMFLIIVGGIVSVQFINILLFFCGIINSEEMILFDSATLSVVAVITSGCMTVLSTRIRVVLMTIGAINSSSTKLQTNRILAMTRVGNAFFLIRVALELAFTVYCVVLMEGKQLSSLNTTISHLTLLTTTFLHLTLHLYLHLHISLITGHIIIAIFKFVFGAIIIICNAITFRAPHQHLIILIPSYNQFYVLLSIHLFTIFHLPLCMRICTHIDLHIFHYLAPSHIHTYSRTRSHLHSLSLHLTTMHFSIQLLYR